MRLGGQIHAPLIHLCVARHTGGIACAITDDGQPLPQSCLEIRRLPWDLPDPAEQPLDIVTGIADRVETKVRQLLSDLGIEPMNLDR